MTTGGFDPQFGDSSYGVSPAGNVEAGPLLPRFFARVIDGIVVGIVGFVIGFVTDTWSNVMVTGLFTGVLMLAYFVTFEVTQNLYPSDRYSVRSLIRHRS